MKGIKKMNSLKNLIIRIIPTKLYLKILFRILMNKKLNFKNPQTYSEKLQWLKIYDHNKEYIKLVDKYEVKEVECLGKEFDPHFEEAVLTEHDETKPENVVLEVLTKGYTYKDKLIRPAMVKVNK